MSTGDRTLSTGQTDVFKTYPHLLQMDSHELSRDDSKRVAHAYYYWQKLCEDVSTKFLEHIDPEFRQMYRRKCSPGSYIYIRKKLLLEDVGVVFNDLKAGLQALRHLSDNERSNYAWSIRQKPKDQLRNYVKAYGVCTTGVVWELIQPYFLYLWLTDDPMVFELINDILQFPVRLTLTDVDWIEEENIQEYLEFEKTAKTWQYDRRTLDELREIVTAWFSDFDITDNQADHGYGATAEVKRSKGTAQKYQKMISTVETSLLTETVNWTPASIAWPRLMPEMHQCLDNYLSTGRGLTASNLLCKVQLVPKGLNKKRVVSMEPTVHQFYQKIIGSAMSRHFDKHPEMRIDLHDQEKNRDLTLKGSKSRRYGTIDLSSASDSVTRTLVRAIFRDTPLYDCLMQCRTTAAALPGNEFVALEKFTPMGSAVCFPVECTVFSAIVQLAMRRKGINRYYRVYGDDIVCHRDIFDEVVKLLQDLNFKVNLDKSFEPALPFKESCGIEAYRGYDVSPLRISRKFDIVKAVKAGKRLDALKLLKPTPYQSRPHLGSKDKDVWQNISPMLYTLYDLGNCAYRKGYQALRKAVIRDTLDIFKSPVFSHNFEHGFFTPATNISFNCIRRQDPNLQTQMVKVLTISSEVRKGDEISRYSKLIEAYDSTRRTSLLLPEDRIESRAGAAVTKYTWEWLPWDVLEAYPPDSFYQEPLSGGSPSDLVLRT